MPITKLIEVLSTVPQAMFQRAVGGTIPGDDRSNHQPAEES